jgi:hypothetical protein
MSNRIDLTQFEGMPKQMEIEWHEHHIYGARYLIRICEPETPWVVGAIVPDFEPYGVFDKDKVEQGKMAKLFAMTPDLIAELTRCYERLDKAYEAMLTAREVLMKHHEWMSMNDATSEEDDQEILDVVKALREASE